MTTAAADLRDTLVPSQDLIAKYGKPGPRYTSYPAAPYWSNAYSVREYGKALRILGLDCEDGEAEVSLYLHVPFCERRCTFCACNVVVSRSHERGRQYVHTLLREMDLAVEAMGGHRPQVCQMHWGGGTPTWLCVEDLDLLCRGIAERFDLQAGREQSIEVDPRVTTVEQLALLRAAGLNRLSMGVQDFDPRVQAAIHRDQSREQTETIIEAARALEIDGINMDLVYGLPFQTVESFGATVDRVIELGADRVALYNFAYLPERLAHHKAISPDWLPTAERRVELFREATGRFLSAGYSMIGLDHFAKGSDELSRAQRDGSIQRNFMGYTTRAGRDLMSFGVSAISRIGRDFAQNVKETGGYTSSVRAGELPIERGMHLRDDDLAREAAIQMLMCHGTVDFAGVERRWGLDLLAGPGVRSELGDLEDAGLIEWDDEALAVTELGRFFLRNIAMVFDAYRGRAALEEVRGRKVQLRFSNTV